MGNWMTVNIVGKCPASEVTALRNALRCDDSFENFHPLCFFDQPSLCGLGDWSAEEISAIGNVAERDYTPESVAKACEKIVKAAPSIALKIHCGGDYESRDCVATITVENGSVVVGGPEVKTLMAISEGQIQANLLRALRR